MSELSIRFPPDPQDGMIYEIIPGVFYQYSKGNNCWVRLDGFDIVGIATSTSDGLMSSEDYKKLLGLIIPPPRITVSAEDCSVKFSVGTLALKSDDDFVIVDKRAEFSHDGMISSAPRNVVGDVWGYDFRIDLERLIAEVEKRGNLARRQREGEQGDKGDKGEHGRDELNTGPVGAAGDQGKNAEFLATVTQDSVNTETVGSETKALVDIEAEDDGVNGKLIARRANVGNPFACPELIVPKKIKSPWLVVLNDNLANRTSTTIIKSESSECCAIQSCIGLHFLYIEPILQAIQTRFEDLVLASKVAKEELAKSWLATMVSVYNEQKAAICCATENLKSRIRNARTRERLEEQRIQAAQGDFSLVIDGEEDKQVVDMDADKACPTTGGKVIEGPTITADDTCNTCRVEFIIDGKANTSQDFALEAQLPAGDYIAQIIDCCVNKAVRRYTGRAILRIKSKTPNIPPKVLSTETTQDTVSPTPGDVADQVFTQDPNEAQSILGNSLIKLPLPADSPNADTIEITIPFPDLGDFTTNEAAKAAYVGSTVTFGHAGGTIKAWVDDQFGQDNAGEIKVCIKPAHCYDPVVDVDEDVILQGAVSIFEDSMTPDNIIGAALSYHSDTLTAAENYYGGSGSDQHGARLIIGPPKKDNVGRIIDYSRAARIFMFDGKDGLSLFIIFGDARSPQNSESLEVIVEGNSTTPSIIVKDDPTDAFHGSNGLFTGTFTHQAQSDGVVIGYFDKVNPQWNAKIRFNNVGLLNDLRVYSGDDTNTALNVSKFGEAIHDSLKDKPFILSAVGSACPMPASQVEWYIRGLRISACCSAVIDFMGQPWAIIKRSIGIDMTCGGGESLNTTCIKLFADSNGHPSIAWPVIMPSMEAIGLPTSGSVIFRNDPELNEQFLTKVRSGDVIVSHGDLREHKFIIFPTLF